MTLTPTDYEDIFVAAVEGGINYWAAVDQYDWNDDEAWAKARIWDTETQESWEIDSRSVLWHNAVAQAAKYFGQTIDAFLEYHDASSADVAMQFAIFGEVIYG